MMNYWNDKETRVQQAKDHTEEMDRLYLDEIKKSISSSKIFSRIPFERMNDLDLPETIVVKTDSVTAAKTYQNGKTAILNFASYKNPGGMFLKGSGAQEESLCHESFLYNVLREFDDSYYSWNRKNLNRGMYTNRALYTPDIRFGDILFDVITCAAPNIGAASKYQSVTSEMNTGILKDRMRFIKNIAEYNGVNTLILGAFGCGVFKQNAMEVAEIWKSLFVTTTIKRIVHPIPDDKNYDCFNKVFNNQ